MFRDLVMKLPPRDVPRRLRGLSLDERRQWFRRRTWMLTAISVCEIVYVVMCLWFLAPHARLLPLGLLVADSIIFAFLLLLSGLALLSARAAWERAKQMI